MQDLLKLLEITVWPGIVIFFLIRFDTEVRGLINRIQKISTPFGSADTAKELQQKTSEESTDELKNKLNHLSQELEKHKDQESKLLETNELAQKGADFFMLRYHFERTYRLIFGSQITLLSMLERLEEMSLKEAYTFYLSTTWNPSYHFSQYIGFLQSQFLLKLDPKRNCYFITNIGKQFLTYLRLNSIPLNKYPS